MPINKPLAPFPAVTTMASNLLLFQKSAERKEKAGKKGRSSASVEQNRSTRRRRRRRRKERETEKHTEKHRERERNTKNERQKK